MAKSPFLATVDLGRIVQSGIRINSRKTYINSIRTLGSHVGNFLIERIILNLNYIDA